MRQVTPLTDGWTLHHPDGTGQALPASVPGCVHTDLLAAGLIPDPFLGRDETEVAWVGRRTWTYERELPAGGPAHERTDLVFDGLDTVAEILLDGRPLGRVRNMHRSYRFDVTGLSGRLTVRFASVYDEADAVRAAVGDRPGAYPEPYQYVRKMACSFGWDWGPTLVTAGIWRRVRLEHWSAARIARVRPLVTVADGAGVVEPAVDVERTEGGAPLDVEASVGGVRARARIEGTAGTVRLRVPDVRLWWPRGYDEQPLYDVELTLFDSEGRWTPGGAGPASGRWSWTPRPTRTAPASPWWSTGSGCSRAGSTGSRTTPSRPGSPANATAGGWSRRPRRAWTWCGCGVAGSTRARTSTTPATSWAC